MLRKLVHSVDETNRSLYAKFIGQILDGKDENDSNYEQLALETCHVAKLLSQLPGNIRILEKQERPDFIIEYNTVRIGLEHEILVDPEKKKKEGSVKNAINIVERKFREKFPKERKLISLFINPNIIIRKVNRDNIVDHIFDVVDIYFNESNLIENDYINDISIMKHSRMDIIPNLGGWWQNDLKEEDILDAIHKKEDKLNSYKTNSQTDIQWLLIVIGSLGDSSFEIENSKDYGFKIQTKYNRIFLMEDFKAKIYEYC